VIVGRADCLPTPINLQRWFKDRQEGKRKRCDQEGLREALKNLRPDIVFERRTERRGGEGRQAARAAEAEAAAAAGAVQGMGMNEMNETRMIEIVEFSCPYGYISHGRDSLIKVYEEKKRKYAELANALKRVTGKQVRVTAVIVSSMGAVYMPSMKDLQKVLKCSDRELKKLGRRMSETVIVGSMEIWRQAAQNIGAGRDDDANRLVEEEAVLAEEAGAAMEVEVEMEEAARSGSGLEGEGEARGEMAMEMDVRVEDIEMEEDGFEADVEAGGELGELGELEEREEVLRFGRRRNVEVEAIMNGGGRAETEARRASMNADEGMEAEARGEVGFGTEFELEEGGEVEVEVEVGRGENPADDECTDYDHCL
jgi:hypothetical protein